MTECRPARALAVVVAAMLAALAVPAAQDELPQPTFRAEANYVRVDAFPTARDGTPVTDLTAADFEVSEDRVPQKIEQFEHVVIRAAGVGEGRPEPNTVAESRQAVRDPRARVFVLFLDPKHVEQGASRQISREIVNALNRLLGPDDYVGLMVPPMRARDVTFARRNLAIERLVGNDWWGKRDSLLPADPTEDSYAFCYPGIAPPPGNGAAPDRGVAQEMILRHREQETFDALEDLVQTLRGMREERKAVLAITDGWLLYRPDQSLTRPLGGQDQPPGNPPLGIDPRSGRLSTANPNDLPEATLRKCELDRQTLANIDDEQRMRTILDEANRSNTSFYPVDPRGLVAFDEGIVPSAGVGTGPLANPTLSAPEENNRLAARATALRRLAEGTDGTAIVGTNNIADALRRVVDDLSSYYLLGYYSTGKLDGKFHAISVRVRRPGVTVRARRGYQALRAGDVARAETSRAPAGPRAPLTAEAARAAAASSAVANLAGGTRDLPLRVHVTAGWHPGAEGHPAAEFWVVGEVVDRIPGADLEVILLNAAGDIVSSARGRIAPGTTSALVTVSPDTAIAPGEYTMRVRSQTPSASETTSVPVVLAGASQASSAVFIRRGPTTGNKPQPTADLRFRRSERLRVEVPSTSDVTGAELLDRTGKPIAAIPVSAATRTDPDGTKWATGELALAPLAPGDYIVELDAGDTRLMAAFRIVL